MVSPGVLQIPEVKRWLAGVEPAWTLLELDSLMALRKEPSAENRALRLAANLMNQDLLGSSIARNAVVLLDDGSTAVHAPLRCLLGRPFRPFGRGLLRNECLLFHGALFHCMFDSRR